MPFNFLSGNTIGFFLLQLYMYISWHIWTFWFDWNIFHNKWIVNYTIKTVLISSYVLHKIFFHSNKTIPYLTKAWKVNKIIVSKPIYLTYSRRTIMEKQAFVKNLASWILFYCDRDIRWWYICLYSKKNTYIWIAEKSVSRAHVTRTFPHLLSFPHKRLLFGLQ